VSVRFYNTMSRGVEPFEPSEPPRVRMYTCGPTVYNFAHIGNLRAYVFEDLLRRHLEYRDFDVLHVMNLTDVDDKTIRASREAGIALGDYTRQYKEAFFEDIATLDLLPAHHYPSATDHIPGMIDLIQRLFEKGLAYQSEDKSVYFSIQKFPEYGKLAHLDLEGLQPGARVDQDEYEKDHVGDFALWKAWDEDDGDVGWESPWGRGRPGWHIECSAMAMHFLSESFDIHCGGVDNIFPHHEDEIAQSEGATGKPFAKYWLHNAHLIVDGKKMAKSSGNFFTLRDILDKGYSGREVRFALLQSAHYRQALNFTFEGLDSARASLNRIDEFAGRLREIAGEVPGEVPDWAVTQHNLFGEALDDDLNISNAMASLFDLIRAGNKRMDEGGLDEAGAAGVLGVLAGMDRILAFLDAKTEETDPEVLALVEAREKARTARDWEAADRIRDELAEKGWTVKDTPGGPKLKRL